MTQRNLNINVRKREGTLYGEELIFFAQATVRADGEMRMPDRYQPFNELSKLLKYARAVRLIMAENYTKPEREKQGACVSLSISRLNIN
jgi:hypothetical protein